jgi:hypothetical protein
MFPEEGARPLITALRTTGNVESPNHETASDFYGQVLV